jgi:hypothetical protein
MPPDHIEKYVLMAIDHIGWFSNLWFPRVFREALNFPEGPTDQEIQSALLRLIEAGALQAGQLAAGEFVQSWDPISQVLDDIQCSSASSYTIRISPEMLGKLQLALKRARVSGRGHFEIWAHGYAFNVDEYLESAPLQFDRVWHRGDGCYETSGLAKRLGNGALMSLENQEQTAIEFLVLNRESLKALAAYPQVEWFFLDFQCTPDSESWSCCTFSLSAELMRCALEVGVTPRFYVVPLDWCHYSWDDFLEGW